MWPFLLLGALLTSLFWGAISLSRRFFVYPIVSKMREAEHQVNDITKMILPASEYASYVEYIYHYGEMYKNLYITCEEPIIYFWSHNSNLVNILMKKSEKQLCANFIDTSYEYQEKYAEYQRFASCASYYM